MGRFYNTEKTTFLNPNDVIYNPDFDTALKLLEKKDKEYKEQEAVADSLYNINFNYLNSDEDTENARVIKDYFQTKADDIIAKMQADPTNYFKYNNELKSLQREYTLSKTKGDIASLEGSYNAYHNWDKINEEICKTQPALCNELKKDAWKQWGGNSLIKQWQQERALKEIDQSKMAAEINMMKADLEQQINTSPSGYIIVTTKNGTEYLTRDRIDEYVKNHVLSNPEYVSYMKQSDRLGLSKWLNPDGTAGETFMSLMNKYRPYAYTQKKVDRDIQDNKGALQAQKHAHDMELEQEKSRLRMLEESAKVSIKAQFGEDGSGKGKSEVTANGSVVTPTAAALQDSREKTILDVTKQYGKGSKFEEIVTKLKNGTKLYDEKLAKEGKTSGMLSKDDTELYKNMLFELISTNEGVDINNLSGEDMTKIAWRAYREANGQNEAKDRKNASKTEYYTEYNPTTMRNETKSRTVFDQNVYNKNLEEDYKAFRERIDKNIRAKYKDYDNKSKEEKDKILKEESEAATLRQSGYALWNHYDYLDNKNYTIFDDTESGMPSYGAWDKQAFEKSMYHIPNAVAAKVNQATTTHISGVNVSSIDKKEQEKLNEAGSALLLIPGVKIFEDNHFHTDAFNKNKAGANLNNAVIAEAMRKGQANFGLGYSYKNNALYGTFMLSKQFLIDKGLPIPENAGNSEMIQYDILVDNIKGMGKEQLDKLYTLAGVSYIPYLQEHNLGSLHYQIERDLAMNNYSGKNVYYDGDNKIVINKEKDGQITMNIYNKDTGNGVGSLHSLNINNTEFAGATGNPVTNVLLQYGAWQDTLKIARQKAQEEAMAQRELNKTSN